MALPTAQELIQTAEGETGLSDWTLDHTGTPFEALAILLSDLQAHAGMHALGEQRFYRALMEVLTSRLKYIADRKRNTGWRDEVVAEPIFILGLPRSGTTFLHNLMGSDPASRAPRLYELCYPSPLPTDSMARQLRIEYCRDRLAYTGMLDEDWLGVHPMGPDRAEECIFFWDLLLTSVTFPAQAEIPNYAEYVFRQDFRAIYREYRDFLKYLQQKAESRRWILKTPIHVRFLEEIIETFPDARFVHCHRDTAKIYPSIANMAAVLHSKFADVPPNESAVAGDYDGTWESALEFRRRPGMAERFVDIHFLDFRDDPIGTVRSIHERLGLPFSRDRANAMSAWLEKDKQQRAAQTHHQYSLADIGLTERDIDEKTGDYLAAFNVKLER